MDRSASAEDLVARLAHDASAGLRIANGYAGIMAEVLATKLDARDRGLLDGVFTGLRRSQAVLDGAAAWAAVRRYEPHPEDVDLDTALIRALATARARAGEPEVQLEADGLGTLRADPDQLVELLGQLLTNALQAHPEDRAIEPVRVEVTRTDTEDAVVLCVRDWGPGIAAEDLPHALEPFVRLDGGAASRPGAGLGLTIVEEVCFRHGGRLQLEAADPGLRATVVLPRGA